jgi:hypothetical protein
MATAAFSECGPRPVELLIEGSELAQAEVRGDSIVCSAALTARVGGTDRREAEWAATHVAVLDGVSGQPLGFHEESAAETATRWGAARVPRDSVLEASYRIVVPGASTVHMTFLYSTVTPGFVTAPRPGGVAEHVFRCALPEAP